jgi:cation/acetate symporter
MVVNLHWLRPLLGLPPATAASRWWDIDPLAAGVFGVPAGLLALVLVSLVTPQATLEESAMLDRLRSPASG